MSDYSFHAPSRYQAGPSQRSAAPKRTTAGETWRLLVQLGMLFLAGLAASFAALALLGSAAPHLTAERRNEAAAQAALARFEAMKQAALAERERKEAELQAMILAWQAAPNEQAASSSAPASPAEAPENAPPPEPAPPVAPADDPLVVAFRDASHLGTPSHFTPLWSMAEDDPRRAELRKLLLGHLQQGALPFPMAARLAMQWDDAEIAAAAVDLAVDDPRRVRDKAPFATLQQLGLQFQDARVGPLSLEVVHASLTRPQGFPEPRLMRECSAGLAQLLPNDSVLWTRHIGQDSPAGDLVRGALTWKSDWPPGTADALGDALIEAESLLHMKLLDWLESWPPPVPVRDALFPRIAREIPRQRTSDARESGLDRVAALAALASPNTARAIAAGAVQLDATNSVAARQLALRMLRRHPYETCAVLAQAAESGRELLPPDLNSPEWAALQRHAAERGVTLAAPSLQTPPWGDEIDAAVAAVAAGYDPQSLPPGLVRVAMRWGGSRTAGVLRTLKASAPANSQAARQLESAANQIDRRLNAAAEAAGRRNSPSASTPPSS